MSISDDLRQARETSPGWYVQRLARILDLWLAEELAPLGLTQPQFAILMRILELGGQTQTQIGGHYALPAYAISRAIDALQDRGFVERRPHPQSRRAHVIHATSAGMALAPKLQIAIARVNAKMSAGMSEPDSAKLLELLQRTHALATGDLKD